MTPGQERDLLVQLKRIAVALERNADVGDAMLERANRPRPLFADYDSGYAAGARAARAELETKCQECGVRIPGGQGIGLSLPESEWTDRSQPRPVRIRPLCIGCMANVIAVYASRVVGVTENG